MTFQPMLESGKQIISRAVELDTQGKFIQARICYEEGIQVFLNAKKLLPKSEESLKNTLLDKIRKYLDRAEQIKKMKIEDKKAPGHDQIPISKGSQGFGYDRLFGRILDEGSSVEVTVEDPYIRSKNQVLNFIHFCEVCVKSISPIQKIHLVTGQGNDVPAQTAWFEKLKGDLSMHNVTFHYEYKNSLHDREIRFSNGWIVKIGRGLDFSWQPRGVTLGLHDYHFRCCSETTVDIFHRNAFHS